MPSSTASGPSGWWWSSWESKGASDSRPRQLFSRVTLRGHCLRSRQLENNFCASFAEGQLGANGVCHFLQEHEVLGQDVLRIGHDSLGLVIRLPFQLHEAAAVLHLRRDRQ